MMNLFPPLLINRIKIIEADQEFKQLKVRIKYSLWNKNLQNAIFGGSIFSAIDPFYAVMYWQILNSKNLPVEVWIKKAEIRYRKAATTNLYIDFKLSNTAINNAIKALQSEEKYEVWHEINAINSTGETYAESKVLVFIRTRPKKHNINF